MDDEIKIRLKRLSREARRLRRLYRDRKECQSALKEVQGALKNRALEIAREVAP